MRSTQVANRIALWAVLAGLAACATPPFDQARTLTHWIQQAPGGGMALRAIVRSGAECPVVSVDHVVRSMPFRAQATLAPRQDAPPPDNPAFNPSFEVASCELRLERSVSEVSVDGQRLALPKQDTRRIVVVGDTGCRIKVPASGQGDPIQDCANPDAWPWPKIATAAARTQPDLVIHVGDYHYREYCADAQRCQALLEQGAIISYGWAGWNADFFTPAASLLAAAPWVFVRGNHENCDRAGEGWMRFLSPGPYRACSDQRIKSASRSLLVNNLTDDAYRVDLNDQLALMIADNSAHEDYRPASATPQELEVFGQTLAALRAAPATQQLWLLSHKPLWYDLLGPAAQPNALQMVLRNTLPANLTLAFAGHQHAFETINFAPDADPAYHPSGRPAQVIVGGSGSQLESLDPESPLYEGVSGVGSQERAQPDGRLYDGVAAASGIVLNRYSFLLLERDDTGWAATVLDKEGLPLSHCRLSGGKKELACTFPER